MTASAPPLDSPSALSAAAWRLGDRVWFTVLLLALLATAVYLPAALQAGFLNFDDNLYFGPDNPEFRSGDLAHILDPRRTIGNAYLPVSHLSLYLDYVLFGGGPTGPHLVSLGLHVLAAFALVRWLLALGVRALPAHVAGAMFLVHPALVESVAWVSSRKDLLSGLFAFLTLWLAAVHARSPGSGRLAALTGCAVLALYSKATAIVLPGLLLLSCWYLRGASRRRWLSVAAVTAVALPIGFHHQLLARSEGTLLSGGLGERLLQVPGALAHYLSTAAWPLELNLLYPEVQTMAAFRAALWPAAIAVGALVLIALAAAARRSGRGLAFGVGLALAALLPFNTAFPASNVAAADRYLYLAIPGLALALVSLGRVGVWVGMLACLPLAWLCADRAEEFQSSEAVWQASLSVEPENAVAQMNLASDLRRRHPEDIAAPRRLYERATEAARFPIHAVLAHENLASLLVLEARYEAAAFHAERAIDRAAELPDTAAGRARRLQTTLSALPVLQLAGGDEAVATAFAGARALAPDDPTVRSFAAVFALAEALSAHGDGGSLAADDPRWQRVGPDLEAALAAHPEHYHAHLVMGRWQQAFGRNLLAIKHFRSAIGARPQAAEAYLAAANVCLNQALYDDAETYARQGLAARADDPALRQTLALALAGQHRWKDAIDHLEAYVQNRPRDRDAARSLAHLLASKAVTELSQSSADELERLAQRALRHDPHQQKVDIVLGKVARDRRQWLVALGHLERAHENFPGDEDVRRMLAMTYFDRGYQLKLHRGNPDAAYDQWRRYLDLALPDMATDTVRGFLENEWDRLEAIGIGLMKAGAYSDAERCFRRCLELLPERHWAAWRLAQSLFERDGADLKEVDDLLVRAIEGQRRHRLDPSRQILYRVLTLQRLDRRGDAERLGREFLADPGAGPDAQVIALIREALGG